MPEPTEDVKDDVQDDAMDVVEYAQPIALPAPPESFDEDLETRPNMPPEQTLLRIKQQTVLGLIMSGDSITAAAQRAQMSRNTIHYWMRHDPPFRTAVTAWRRRSRQEAGDQILLMTQAALRTLRAAVIDGNLTAALAVLKSQGLLSRRRAAKRPAARQKVRPMTPNVVMEHSRTTVAMRVPTQLPAAPAPADAPQLE